MLNKYLKITWNEFIYGGHILSLGGSSVAYTTSLLLDIKITWNFPLMIYLGLQAIYLYDRYLGKRHDILTNTERTKHLSRYFKKMPLIIFFYLLFFGIILLSSKNVNFIIFASILVIVSFMYAIFLKKFTKKIFAFKNFFVSFCWSSITILLALYYSYPLNKELFLIFSFAFIVLFANISFCDIKDYEGDKKRGMLTPVVVLGREKLLKLLRIIIAFSAIPIIYGAYLNLLPKFALFLLFIIPYSFYYFSKAMNEKANLNYLTNTLVYGGYILWSVFVYIGKILI